MRLENAVIVSYESVRVRVTQNLKGETNLSPERKEETKKNFMERLHDEIMLADPEAFPPKDPVRKTDDVMGECTDYMRRVWSLARFLEREMKQAKIELEYSTEKDPKLIARIDELHDKSKMLQCMVWVEGQEVFKMWGHEKGLGVRVGWKFVEFDREEPEIIKTLKGMFGSE